MRILGIETSCDETGVAIYDEEKGLIANQLHTQIALHADYGGVVPELASRDHIRKLAPLLQAALQEANLMEESMAHVYVTTSETKVQLMISAISWFFCDFLENIDLLSVYSSVITFLISSHSLPMRLLASSRLTTLPSVPVFVLPNIVL